MLYSDFLEYFKTNNNYETKINYGAAMLGN